MMRKISIILIAFLAISFSVEAKRQITRAENDSIVQALATIWGQYLHNKELKATDKAENEQYMRGLTEALKLADKPSSYYLGLQDGIVIDNRLQQVEDMGGFTISREKISRAFQRAAKGRGTGFTPQTADRYMNYIMAAISADEKVTQDSQAFLDSIARKEGIHSSKTGLLYEIVTEGKGKQVPMNGADVLITYVGRLYDGTVFDDKHATKPVRFDINNLITGFAEGIYRMRCGDTYRLYLPASIAYGETGVPGSIPGNAALVFDVNLLEVYPH